MFISFFLFSITFISCSKRKDDEVLKNIITKNVDFNLVDFNSWPANSVFLSCFKKDGFHFLSFPDGGVYGTLFSEDMEIYVPYNEDNVIYDEFRIELPNSYIHNENKKYDENIILPQLIKILGIYNYELIHLHLCNHNTDSFIEITSSLPMWNLPDRKVYLYGSNVDRNNDKSTFSNVCIIIKMK